MTNHHNNPRGYIRMPQSTTHVYDLGTYEQMQVELALQLAMKTIEMVTCQPEDNPRTVKEMFEAAENEYLDADTIRYLADIFTTGGHNTISIHKTIKEL